MMNRDERRATNQNIKALVSVYQATREETPEDTIAAFVAEVGYSVAVETIATVVKTVGAWDARVWDTARRWATENTRYSSQDLAEAYIFQPGEIHPSHINQIAEAMMNYSPEEPADLEEVVAEAVAEELGAEKEPEAEAAAQAQTSAETTEATEIVSEPAEEVKPAHLKHTMLTTSILTRFESLVDISDWTAERLEQVEYLAYVACIGRDEADRWQWFARLIEKDLDIDLLVLELPKRVSEMVEASPARSAWSKGVKEYAAELLGQFIDGCADGWLDPSDMLSPSLFEKDLLNGADDWQMFSEGGCSLCYNQDIAERLCTPSELKRTAYGMKDPNPRETWIDCQTRALRQAWWLIEEMTREAKLLGISSAAC